MMPSRLRTVLSVTLALVLSWTSGLQAARALIDGSLSTSMSAHQQSNMATEGKRGHHDHASVAPDERLNCLLVCLDAYPHGYLAAELSRKSAPDPSVFYPFPPSPMAQWHESRDLSSIYRAPRGPPRRQVGLSSDNSRRLLLQTARLRI